MKTVICSRFVIVCSLVLTWLALLVQHGFAWNSTGHQTVALIAVLELKESQKNAIFEVLKSHPHTKIKKLGGMNYFLADRPGDVPSERDWAILRAATWPDFVRPPQKVPPYTREQLDADEVWKYHQPDRHFFDIPFVNANLKQPSLPAPNAVDIIGALKDMENALSDPKMTPADKAISLCWILHLVGDIHQPLHCTTMFSRDFPIGDRGGNSLLVGSGNLHSFWDELLGESHASFGHIETTALALMRTSVTSRANLPESSETNPKKWAEESHEIAVKIAYQDGALQGASTHHQHDDGPFAIPPFPDGYKQQARLAAQRRVALAGYRLADKLGKLYP